MINKIKLDLYPFITIYLVHKVDSIQGAFEEISKREGYWVMPERHSEQCGSFVAKLDSDIYVAIVDKGDDILIHELVHATWDIAKCLDMQYDHDNQELQAYLLQFLYKEAQKIVKKKAPRAKG